MPAMFSFRPQPITAGLLATEPYYRAEEDSAGWIVAESPPQYRPRHPERSALYQRFETHFDSYVRAYEERFEPRSGPLRPVVVPSVEEFLSCGRLDGGFARIRCTKCRKEHLLAFSCRTMGPTPIAGGFPWRPQRTTTPPRRARNMASRTFRMVPGKRAARGLG